MTPEQQAHLDAILQARDNALILRDLIDLGLTTGAPEEDVAGLVALAHATVRDASTHAAALVGDPG